MTKLGGLLGLKGSGDGDNRGAQPADQDNVIGVDEELFSPAGQIGEENEAIRNLLLDAEIRVGELEAVKATFGKLVEPINKALRQVETERAEKLSLQTTLSNTRAAHGKARSDLAVAEKKVTAFEAECAQVKTELRLAQQLILTLESTNTEQASEVASQRAKLTDIERRLEQSLIQENALRNEIIRFGERMAASDKRIVQLESEVEANRQKKVLLEEESSTIQTTLSQAHEEITRLSRRLIESEKAFASTHARLLQTEAALSETSSERARLAAALDDVNEKHRTDTTSQNARYETLHARALMTEKLLDEARQSMANRAEQIRAFDRRVSEASLIRSTLEGKLGEIERAHAEREAQIRQLERTRNTLVDRNATLTRTISARESELERAEEKALSFDNRLGLLESELLAAQLTSEQEIEALRAELQREKLERSMTEGALETGRKDIARLMRELTALQSRQGTATVPPVPLRRYTNAA